MIYSRLVQGLSEQHLLSALWSNCGIFRAACGWALVLRQSVILCPIFDIDRPEIAFL